MQQKLLALSQAILREAERQRITVGAVRLVKLLYLLEVEFYKANGRRLTDATWRYYLYGPYPDEFKELAERPGIVTEDVPLTGERIFRKLAVEEGTVDLSSMLRAEETRLIPFVVKEWGDAWLNSLLNYVYFHTPPMQAAKVRGEVLDFSTIRATVAPQAMFAIAPPAMRAVEIPTAALKKIQGLYQEYVKREHSKPKRRVLSPRKDAIYVKALQTLNAAEKAVLRGEVEITEENFPFLSSQK